MEILLKWKYLSDTKYNLKWKIFKFLWLLAVLLISMASYKWHLSLLQDMENFFIMLTKKYV